MAESHVISGLVSKRAEVAGHINSCHAELKRLQEALSHLDGSIKLFSPQFDLRTLKARRTQKSNGHFVKSEAQRMMLDALRVAAKPLNSLEITATLLNAKGIEPTGTAAARVRENVFTVMRRLEARQIVRECNGGAGVKTWAIA